MSSQQSVPSAVVAQSAAVATATPPNSHTGTDQGPNSDASLSPEPKPEKASRDAASGRVGVGSGPAIGSEPAVLLLDVNRKIVAAHPSCAELFRQNHNELVGLPLEALLKRDPQNELERVLQSQDAAGPGEFKAIPRHLQTVVEQFAVLLDGYFSGAAARHRVLGIRDRHNASEYADRARTGGRPDSE
jgi:PAS domain-containing protein